MAIVERAEPILLRAPNPAQDAADPRWYRRAVVYQLHVRGFFDSNADGIGDFAGLTKKLDYLQDLGATALWLLPFFPSPLKDGGYDISDFRAVDPGCGSLRDFRHFLAQAHRRHLRVIAELVLNHTSDQHIWFQRARRAPPGSSARQYYVWNDSALRYPDARVIFDQEPSNWTWDPLAGAYYFHRFYAHEPDLNYDHPEVQRAMLQVVDYWLSLGVDGLGLNTIAYLFERDGTACENLPENHAFLKRLRGHVEARFGDRLLVAAVNQWPEDAAAYFGDGDQCQAALHFPLMPRLYMALQAEDRRPIVDILQQTPAGPDGCQWVLFLRNQDELTLQMVTEQERSALLRHYAQDPQFRIHSGIRRRLATLMENHRAKIELLGAVLLSLPGTPAIYYGDEIGMGDNPYLGDRAGVRTPMQWSCDRNAGFSQANPQQLFLPVITDPSSHFETVNVETQRQNGHSLWAWTRRMIARRRRSPALTEGSLEFVDPRNGKLLAYLRSHEEEIVLVVANLSRFAQVAQIDLRQFAGRRPVELFGGTAFPPIGRLPYMLTLAPYGFYWLALRPEGEPPGAGHSLEGDAPLAVLELEGDWTSAFHWPARETLQQLLPGFLHSRRWFGGKARAIRCVEVADVTPMPYSGPEGTICWTLLEVEYLQAPSERYIVPLALASEEGLRWRGGQPAEAVVARLRFQRDGQWQERLLYDAFGEEEFSQAVLAMIGGRKALGGRLGRLQAWTTRAYARLRGDDRERLQARALKAESSNSIVLYDQRFLLKLVRRLDDGVNPDLEIGVFLTEAAGFTHAPPVAGAIEYSRSGEPMTVGILSEFVANHGNAWDYTLASLEGFFEPLVEEAANEDARPEIRDGLLDLARRQTPELAARRLGAYLDSAALLGRRTAELHLALADGRGNPRFAAEPFTQLYQRSLYQGLRNQSHAALDLLRQRLDRLPEAARGNAEAVLAAGPLVLARFQPLLEDRIEATRTRCHGDYHLGQVLWTGSDFLIIDFEGEPARPISERQLKASPLRDVAGMLRSFDYACHAALAERLGRRTVDALRREALAGWVVFWVAWTGAAYLRSYLETARGASFLPPSDSQTRVLLESYLCEKALYELQYELNNRPDWAHIPLAGLRRLAEGGTAKDEGGRSGSAVLSGPLNPEP